MEQLKDLDKDLTAELERVQSEYAKIIAKAQKQIDLAKGKKDKDLTVRDNVYQSNQITQSHLPFTKLEADIFTLTLATLKAEKSKYVYNIKDIMLHLKLEAKHYKNFVGALNGLYEKSIIIKHENGATEKIRLLSQIKYQDPKNISINDDVEITITESIKPHLFDLKKHYTIYETNSFLQLDSINSKKLYTIFAQFKSTGKIRMSKQQIQDVLNVNYHDFSVLMAKVIKPSIKEIMNKTNVKNIDIQPIKRGRIIDGYYFNFEYKVYQLELPLLPKETTPKQLEIYDQLINKFRLTKSQATTILENVAPQEINKTFYDLNIQLNNHKVENIGGYTLTIFKNKFNLKF
jgi:plasmid replication initiation protein